MIPESVSFRRVLLVLTLGLLLGLSGAYAQEPGSGGPTPGGATPTAVPIDGGASLLLAAGVGAAVHKLRARRRQA